MVKSKKSNRHEKTTLSKLQDHVTLQKGNTDEKSVFPIYFPKLRQNNIFYLIFFLFFFLVLTSDK